MRHTILVVDDEADLVDSVQDLLRVEHDVLGATSGAAGMQAMRDHDVHVVLSDLLMPDMNGLEFLARVHGDYPDAVALLLTGCADGADVLAAVQAGRVYRFVTKPWEPDELQSAVRGAVARYEQASARRPAAAQSPPAAPDRVPR
jgi:DNA-binding NtrC family response regulator